MFGANRQSGNAARAPRRADARLAADPGWALGTPHYRSADMRQANRPTCTDVPPSQPTRAYRRETSAEDRVQPREVSVDDPGDVLHGLDAVGRGLTPGRRGAQDGHLVADAVPGEHSEAVNEPVSGRRMRQPAVLDVHRQARAGAGGHAPPLRRDYV